MGSIDQFAAGQQPAPVHTIEDLADPVHRKIYEYWEQLRGQDDLPSYADFDVMDIEKPLLPSLYLAEYIPEKSDFLQRVLGTLIDQNNGFSASGTYLSDLPITTKTNLSLVFKHVIDTGIPHLSNSPYYGRHSTGKRVYRVTLPLMKNGETRMVFGTSVFEFGDDTDLIVSK